MLRCEHVASHQLAAGLYRRERCEPMTVVSAAVSDVPHAVSVCVCAHVTSTCGQSSSGRRQPDTVMWYK